MDVETTTTTADTTTAAAAAATVEIQDVENPLKSFLQVVEDIRVHMANGPPVLAPDASVEDSIRAQINYKEAACHTFLHAIKHIVCLIAVKPTPMSEHMSSLIACTLIGVCSVPLDIKTINTSKKGLADQLAAWERLAHHLMMFFDTIMKLLEEENPAPQDSPPVVSSETPHPTDTTKEDHDDQQTQVALDKKMESCSLDPVDE